MTAGPCPQCFSVVTEQGNVINTCLACNHRWERYPGYTRDALKDALMSSTTKADSGLIREGKLRPGESWPTEAEERLVVPILCPTCSSKGLAAPGTTVRCPKCSTIVTVRSGKII